jgi:hypothetical protein
VLHAKQGEKRLIMSMFPESGVLVQSAWARIITNKPSLCAQIHPLGYKLSGRGARTPDGKTCLDRRRMENPITIHVQGHKSIAFSPLRDGTVPRNLDTRHDILTVVFHPSKVGIQMLIQLLKGVDPADIAIEHNLPIRHFF